MALLEQDHITLLSSRPQFGIYIGRDSVRYNVTTTRRDIPRTDVLRKNPGYVLGELEDLITLRGESTPVTASVDFLVFSLTGSLITAAAISGQEGDISGAILLLDQAAGIIDMKRSITFKQEFDLFGADSPIVRQNYDVTNLLLKEDPTGKKLLSEAGKRVMGKNSAFPLLEPMIGYIPEYRQLGVERALHDYKQVYSLAKRMKM